MADIKIWSQFLSLWHSNMLNGTIFPRHILSSDVHSKSLLNFNWFVFGPHYFNVLHLSFMSVQRIEGLLTVYVDEIYLFTVPNDICDFFPSKNSQLQRSRDIKVHFKTIYKVKYLMKNCWLSHCVTINGN